MASSPRLERSDNRGAKRSLFSFPTFFQPYGLEKSWTECCSPAQIVLTLFCELNIL